MSNSIHEAEVIAIVGNKIVFVGSNSEYSRLIGSNTRVTDCRGMAILPDLLMFY